MPGKYSFNKKERLKSKKDIERVLKKGHQKVFFPFKVFIFKHQAKAPGLKLVVIVPKRKISSAVKRNRTKRIMRECWRINKHMLEPKLKQLNNEIHVALLYLESVPPKFCEVKGKISKLIDYISSYG